MERTDAERRALWGAGAVVVGSLLPWGTNGGPVWGFQTAGIVTLILGLVAWWLALMWRSPVSIGIALAAVLGVWILGVVVVASVYDAIAVTTFVVPVGAGVGLHGAWSQAPARD